MRTAMGFAVGSLVMLPFIPILPALGSLLALVGVLSARQRRLAPPWMTLMVVVVGGLGLLLAYIQLLVILLAALGVGS